MKQVGLELRNPFLIYGYASLRYFCDQTEETEKMLSALENGRHCLDYFPAYWKNGVHKDVFYNMQQRQAKDDVACFLYGHICHAEFVCFCLLAGKNSTWTVGYA